MLIQLKYHQSHMVLMSSNALVSEKKNIFFQGLLKILTLILTMLSFLISQKVFG